MLKKYFYKITSVFCSVMYKFIVFILLTFVFITYGYAQRQQLDSLQIIMRKIKKNPQYEKDTNYLKTLHELGYAYYAVKPDSMRITAERFYTLAKKISYQKGISRALQDLGLYYYGQGNYTKALEFLLEALRIAEKIQDSHNISTCYNNIAIVYQSQNKHDKALAYYYKALAINKVTKDKHGEANSYNNIGHVLGELKQYDKALLQHLESLKINEKLADKQGLAYNYNNIGGNYNKINKPEIALLYLDKAHKISQEIGDKDIENDILLNLAETHILLKNFETALTFSKQGLEIAKELKNREGIRNNFQTLSHVYEAVGDYKNALENHKLFKVQQDSLLNDDNIQKNNALQTQYDYEKKEAVWQAKQDKKMAEQHFYTYLFLSAFIFAIIFVLMLFLNQRRILKANRIIFSQKVEIETINIELEAQAYYLKDVNALKDKLFSIIGHDLKSPLSQIKGILPILESGMITPEEFQHISNNIKQNLSHASDLLDNLFRWATSQLGGEMVKPQLFDLQEVIAENIQLYTQAAITKDITIENRLTSKLLVWADIDMIDLVVRNLLSNALKFCKTADSVYFSVSQTDSYATVCLSDTGIGISPEVLPTLFGEGHASARGTAGEKGTGLGLTLCRDFVLKNDGKIWVESTLGVGSQFYFTIPLTESQPMQPLV